MAPRAEPGAAGRGHRDSTLGAFVFAGALAAVLGLLVSSAANVLAPRIAANKEMERKRHVLIASGLIDARVRADRERIETLYRERIVELEVRVGDTEQPLFVAKTERGDTAARCLPVAGPGLWGPIKGYVSVDATGTKIVGVTFYEHQETPGLGAEIADPRWTRKWRGKSIVDASGTLTSVLVNKGPIDTTNPWLVEHAVDGISGATVTSKAVEGLVRKALTDYQRHLGAP